MAKGGTIQGEEQVTAMRIEVRLAGFLKRVGLPGGFTGGSVETPDGATVTDLLAQIGVTKNMPWLITHNGDLAQLAAVLQDGDSILIIPPISGGNEHPKNESRQHQK